MKQHALASTFLLLGVLLLALLIAVLVAAWPTVMVLSHFIVWGMLVSLSLAAIGKGTYHAIHAYLSIKERRQALRHADERHALATHLALTRVFPDAIGNYPALLAKYEHFTYLPPGNSFRGPQKVKVSDLGASALVPLPAPNQTPQLPAPVVPTFAELLQSGYVLPYESESILGYTNGQPRRGPWAKLHSFFVVGMSGAGKSSTVAYYAALAVLHGARLLIIDPDADEDESISKRLAHLSFALLAPVASTPQGAARVLTIAEKEMENGPSSYPVLWITDEFSTIIRSIKLGGPWASVAQRLALSAENWAQRGRKRGRTTIVIGQIAKASRTGGTELRASMTATFIHRIPAQQARMVIDSDTANDAPNLDVGEVMVQLANAAEPYRMHIPYATVEDMHTVARLMRGSRGIQEPFTGRSALVQMPPRSGGEMDDETDTNPPPNVVERVSALYHQGLSKRAIIGEMWGARPGGTQAWQEASRRYDEIIAQLHDDEDEPDEQEEVC